MPLQQFTMEQAISIGIVIALLATLLSYLFVRMAVQKKRIRRVAQSDRELFKKRHEDQELFEEIEIVLGTTPQIIGEITGFSIATILLVITLLQQMQPGTGEFWITSGGLVGIGVAGICYIMAMEQFTTSLSPSLREKERFDLYWEATNLKTLAFASLWGAVILLMALVNMYAVLIVSIYTAALVIRHFEMRWVRRED